MKNKLFTPLNVGPFDLKHRVVVDWGRTGIDRPDIADHIISTMRDPVFGKGLMIFDPGPLIWPERAHLAGPAFDSLKEAWHHLVGGAKSACVSTIARLDVDMASLIPSWAGGARSFSRPEIEQIIDAYIQAARHAKAAGFDGVELDGTCGTVTDLFLRSSTTLRPNGHDGSLQRINFVIELIQALTWTFGRERVGIRLSPFQERGGHGESNIYGQALRSLHDHEISYVHLVETMFSNQFLADTASLTPLAEILRQAYPGILIASDQKSLPLAIDLVERRWADAICFSGGKLDAAQLRRAWSQGTDS